MAAVRAVAARGTLAAAAAARAVKITNKRFFTDTELYRH
jgi:hypothetical protein